MRFRKVYRSYASIVWMVVLYSLFYYYLGKDWVVLLFLLATSIIWVYLCSYYIIMLLKELRSRLRLFKRLLFCG